MTVDPALFGNGLKQLSAAGIKVVSISIAKNAKPYGVTFNYIGSTEVDNDGKLLADWVIANKGAKANAVFYGLPTFDFSNPLQQAFVNEMKKECPSCTVRTVPIDAATIGTTAPSTVVADLQAHPATNVAVFVEPPDRPGAARGDARGRPDGDHDGGSRPHPGKPAGHQDRRR